MTYSTVDPYRDPYQSSRMRRHRTQRRRLRIVSEIRTEIVQRGVAIVEGDVTVHGVERTVHYTVGLTRHEGHPEIIIVEECCECAHHVLTAVADIVREGSNLGHGWGINIDGVDHILVEVETPEILQMAQEIYAGPGETVLALELIPTEP